jgi:hypothetical protein
LELAILTFAALRASLVRMVYYTVHS